MASTNDMIEITHSIINTNKVLESVNSTSAGAAVLFVGTTRQMTRGRETLKLDYECYEEMALKKMEQLRDQAVSYTHLRAHETSLHLVCRLLLEKQNSS